MPSRDVVEGDIVEVGRGDQIVVDGVVLSSDDLEVDESLLTGESEPVAKAQGSTLAVGLVGRRRERPATRGSRRRGGLRPADRGGRPAIRAREVGAARRRRRDPARRHVGARAHRGPACSSASWRWPSDLSEALRVSVAGVVNMVPEGLVLLLSTALAVGIIRLGRKRVLVGELGALEGLARVDVLCVDKTGTLTDGSPSSSPSSR